MPRKESVSSQSELIRVLWITPQCAPFAAMGGLAPIPLNMTKMFCDLRRTAELPNIEIDVRIVMPYYDIPGKCQYTEFKDSEIKDKSTVSLSVGKLSVQHLQGEYATDKYIIHVYAIRNDFDGENLFAPLPTPRNKTVVVSNADKRLAKREAERFAWFCRASLCFITDFLVKQEKWIPNILHCHDWQTGLTPIYLQYNWKQLLGSYDMRTLFTFHFSPGPRLQGLFAELNCCPPLDLLKAIGLYDYRAQIYDPNDPEPNLRHQSDKYMPHLKGGVYYLKAGAAFATLFNTVSPNYGRMIDRGEPNVDPGLSGVLQGRPFNVQNTSILLGTDPKDNPNNPQIQIACHYNIATCIEGKKCNKSKLKKWFNEKLECKIEEAVTEEDKQELQKSQQNLQEFNLNAEDFLVVFLARLDPLKGQEILLEQIDRIFSEMSKVKIITMGSVNPDPRAQAILRSMRRVASAYPDRFLYIYGWDKLWASMLMAACDLYLMPSWSETCGTGQMKALQYGALVLGSRVGGIPNTIVDTPPGLTVPIQPVLPQAYGFLFDIEWTLDPPDTSSRKFQTACSDFYRALKKAYDMFNRNRDVWNELVKEAMKADNSWLRCAIRYASLYQTI